MSAFTLGLLSACPVTAFAQRADGELVTEIESLGRPIVGGSFGLVAGTGEAFEFTGTGWGTHLFVGVPFKSSYEVRVGASLSSFPDKIAEPRITVFSLYLETYWARRVSSVLVRLGPRLFWARGSGSRYLAVYGEDVLNGLGAGGVAGVQIPLTERALLEGGLSLSMMSFGTSQSIDPDGRAAGTMWEVRLGVAIQMGES
jgi:hypothetical protein